jgi:hypothetical protein
MLYLAVALVVYVLTAAELLRGGAPASFREAVGGALACALVAAVWPLALIWRGLLGGSRPDPIQSPVAEGFTAKYAKDAERI